MLEVGRADGATLRFRILGSCPLPYNGLSPRTRRASLPIEPWCPELPCGDRWESGVSGWRCRDRLREPQSLERAELIATGRGHAWRWEGPGLANQDQGECVALWPEVSSYSRCGSKQQLGQGAEIVTRTGRPPGERSEPGIPSEHPFSSFLHNPFLPSAGGGGLDPSTYGQLTGGGMEACKG